MKKIFILSILLVAYSNIFAFLTQRNWRWHNDDGTETTATWKAAENTPFTLTSTGEIFRLRLEVYNNSGDTVDVGGGDTLQYATSASGPWTNLDTLAGLNAFMIATTSSFVMQDQPTTSQLTGIALPFMPGKIMVDSMVMKNFVIADTTRTEFEWVIRGTSNLLPNTTYYFRQWGATANKLDVGDTYPSLTTAAVLPIKLSGFAVNRDDKKIKIEWATTSEQNNDRFEVQRSSDGRTWQIIASVQGNGTTSASNTYRVYDESPLNGINYYVIRQYDADGHSYLSDVRFLRMIKEGASLVLISPNPSRSGINFSLTDKGASNVEAILNDINGRTIYREIIKTLQANVSNKLNLRQQPAPGIYFLKLKAQGLAEHARVVVE